MTDKRKKELIEEFANSPDQLESITPKPVKLNKGEAALVATLTDLIVFSGIHSAYQQAFGYDLIFGAWDKTNRAAMLGLVRKGLIAERPQYVESYYIDGDDLTPLFWEYIGTTPALLALERVKAEYERVKNHAERGESASWTRAGNRHEIAFFSSLYGREMSQLEIYMHQRDRIFSNACSYETELQEIEITLSRLEILVGKGL